MVLPITLSDLLTADTSSLTALASSLNLDFSTTPAFDVSSLQSSINATASAGETAAASSSRSTAASQRDDEEEVAEVDEVAFQDLKNYDENPQGILLPDDQQFAYDDEGSIYFMITGSGGKNVISGEKQPASSQEAFGRFPLYRVDLDLSQNDKNETAQAVFESTFACSLIGNGAEPITASKSGITSRYQRGYISFYGEFEESGEYRVNGGRRLTTLLSFTSFHF